MKDAEFIELLNLYLDHEISAEDADRIEREVRQNSARRQIYLDYCRLQKACTLLAKDYVEQSAAAGAAEDRKLVAFEPRPAWGPGAYLGGFAAVAACVAVLVFANQSVKVSPGVNATNAVAEVAPASTAPLNAEVHPAVSGADTAARTIAQTVTVPTPRTEPRPIFTASSLTLSKDLSNGAVVATNQPTLDAQFEWLRDVQFTPIQRVPADNLRFDAKADLKASPRPYGPGGIQSDVQNAAFQFQRGR